MVAQLLALSDPWLAAFDWWLVNTNCCSENQPSYVTEPEYFGEFGYSSQQSRLHAPPPIAFVDGSMPEVMATD
jgi:hypothetical protein